MRHVGGVLGFDLGRLFGLRDIEVGLPEFDRQFAITANDEAREGAFRTHSARPGAGRIAHFCRLDPPIDKKLCSMQ